MVKTTLAADDVSSFLASRHGMPVTDVEPLLGGFWSSAFGYRLGGRELVVRFGSIRSGFEADLAAMAYASPELPVPEVLEVGDAFDGAYAISARHHGRFLESVGVDEDAGPMLERLLAALHGVAPPEPRVDDASSWHRWLVDGLVDQPGRPESGWRKTLSEDEELDRLFDACDARVRSLAAACPERRDLVHGDLLHGNVLVDEDASRVNAVFSWKCSVRGDFLFDTAWCTFWGGSFHPGIAAADAWGRVVTSAWARRDPGALADAAARHHCYELHIGATHLGWHAWVGDLDNLRAVAAYTAMLLERGPLAMPVQPNG